MTDTTALEETDSAPTPQALSRIDAPLDRRRLGDMTVEKFAGLTFREYREAVEFSKLIAQAKNGIPAYLRGNPGDCLVVCTQALRWKLEPVWCLQHSYVTKDEALITYDSAVHAAIVLSCAPLKARPRYEYFGEGEERRCTVTATFIGESEPHEYTTPPIKQVRPGTNEKGIIRGSPLWTRDPDQQLGYYAIRNWGRRHCPELLGGVYDRDEFEDSTQKETDVIPPSPNLLNRLPGKIEGAGFAENVVDTGLARQAATEEAGKDATRKARGAARKARDTPNPEPAETGADPGELAGEAAVPSGPPTSIEEYRAHVLNWLCQGTDPDELEVRWGRETDMRQSLKIPLEIRREILAAVEARVQELRTAKKKR
jgi:hypothetical protein